MGLNFSQLAAFFGHGDSEESEDGSINISTTATLRYLNIFFQLYSSGGKNSIWS
jgi:hypothetical protein